MKKNISFFLSLFIVIAFYKPAKPLTDVQKAKIIAGAIGVLSAGVAGFQLSRETSDEEKKDNVEEENDTDNKKKLLTNVLTCLSIGTVNALCAYIVLWLGYVSPNQKYHEAVTFSNIMRDIRNIDKNTQVIDGSAAKSILIEKKERFEKYKHHFTDEMKNEFAQAWDKFTPIFLEN